MARPTAAWLPGDARLHLKTKSVDDEYNGSGGHGGHGDYGDDEAKGSVKPSAPSAALVSRPVFRPSADSQQTIRATATPPIDIPAPSDEDEAFVQDGAQASFMDHYMHNRTPSVSFNNEVRLECGHRQSINEPLAKSAQARPRGRSARLATQGSHLQSMRSHSEADRARFDPITGHRLLKFSASPPREQPKVGEGRFPLLQTTVDAMARESQSDPPQALGVSPGDDESRSLQDDGELAASPDEVVASPLTSPAAFSYEETKSFRRTASQRWREGQHSESARDFFSRAGSLRQSGRTMSSGRLARKETTGDYRSPRSAASSFLRAFSMSSSTSDGVDSAGQPAVDAEGQTIGEDYVLGKQIGYGGFSVVKEVTQFRDGKQRKLAVKIVRRHIEGRSEAENELAQAEFEHEVELWRFLDHPNILPLEAVYKLDEATFCFIPLNTGGTLFDLVRANRQGLPMDLATSYSYQMAAALRYLHLDARVVHRDLKLENVLVERNPKNPRDPGLIRLCDFGMAEWLSRDSESSFSSGPPSPTVHDADRPPPRPFGPADSSTSAFAGGSLEYAAPEILRLSNSRSSASPDPEPHVDGAGRSLVSAAVDIWSYGVCVYTLLAGSRPFQDSFQPRVVMAILAGDWDRERLSGKAGPDALELVEHCLEMDPVKRWTISDILKSPWLAAAVAAATAEDDSASNVWKL
ncbi:hypothetical protein DV737_g638, partial [Chaetothyriales sp. CBS 132003]